MDLLYYLWVANVFLFWSSDAFHVVLVQLQVDLFEFFWMLAAFHVVGCSEFFWVELIYVRFDFVV